MSDAAQEGPEPLKCVYVPVAKWYGTCLCGIDVSSILMYWFKSNIPHHKQGNAGSIPAWHTIRVNIVLIKLIFVEIKQVHLTGPTVKASLI